MAIDEARQDQRHAGGLDERRDVASVACHRVMRGDAERLVHPDDSDRRHRFRARSASRTAPAGRRSTRPTCGRCVSSEPSRMAPRRISFDRIAQRRIARREDADVMARRDRVGLHRDSRQSCAAARPARCRAARHRRAQAADRCTDARRRRTDTACNPYAPFRAEQDFVGDRAAERADAASSQIGQPAEAARVRVADREHFAERVVRNRRRHRGAARRRIFHPAQTDLRGAAFNGLIDRAVRHEQKARRPVDPARDRARRSRRRTGDLVRDRRDRPRRRARRLQGRPPSAAPLAGPLTPKGKGKREKAKGKARQGSKTARKSACVRLRRRLRRDLAEA